MLDLFITVEKFPTLIEVVRQETSLVEEIEIEIPEVEYVIDPNGCEPEMFWASESPHYCIPKPQPSPRPINTQNKPETIKNSSPVVSRPVVDSTNAYTAGNCTWYVKSRRPDLPNNLGNANTWTIRARNQGLPTGATPRAGAVGQKGMHVVYVTSVNGDGTFNLIEMNYRALYGITERTVSASGWNFIY